MSVAAAAPPVARNSFATVSRRAGIELGQRLAGEARELVERRAHQRGIAAERRQDVGLDRRIVRAGHPVLVAGRE